MTCSSRDLLPTSSSTRCKLKLPHRLPPLPNVPGHNLKRMPPSKLSWRSVPPRRQRRKPSNRLLLRQKPNKRQKLKIRAMLSHQSQNKSRKLKKKLNKPQSKKTMRMKKKRTLKTALVMNLIFD